MSRHPSFCLIGFGEVYGATGSDPELKAVAVSENEVFSCCLDCLELAV
jgi:hypothetical protein